MPEMISCVMILSDGTIHKGDYDGYGGIDDEERAYEWAIGEPDCYHQSCWEVLGSPIEYTGGSHPAQDQGHFYREDDPDTEYIKLNRKEFG